MLSKNFFFSQNITGMPWIYTVRLEIIFYSIKLLHLSSPSKTCLSPTFYLTKVNCIFTYLSKCKINATIFGYVKY